MIRELVHALTRKIPGSGAPDRERVPVVHDYTRRFWGHDYSWEPDKGSNGLRGKAHGWGSGIEEGDILAFLGPNGGPSPYRVVSIRYMLDPMDMWFADVRFDPRGYQLAMEKVVGPGVEPGA